MFFPVTFFSPLTCLPNFRIDPPRYEPPLRPSVFNFFSHFPFVTETLVPHSFSYFGSSPSLSKPARLSPLDFSDVFQGHQFLISKYGTTAIFLLSVSSFFPSFSPQRGPRRRLLFCSRLAHWKVRVPVAAPDHGIDN